MTSKVVGVFQLGNQKVTMNHLLKTNFRLLLVPVNEQVQLFGMVKKSDYDMNHPSTKSKGPTIVLVSSDLNFQPSPHPGRRRRYPL